MLKILIVLLLAISCGNKNIRPPYQEDYNYSERYYQSSGKQKYFLTLLPDWSNYSQNGECKRTSSIRYLNFNNVSKSFNLNYNQMLQLQGMYNFRLRSIKSEKKAKFITLKVEEVLFQNMLDRVLSGIYYLTPPKFKRVHVVWVDSALGNKKVFNSIKRTIRSDGFAKGYPIFLSFCLASKELSRFIKSIGYENQSHKAIPSELISPFRNTKDDLSYFQLNLTELLGKNKKIYLYSSKGRVPKGLKGKFKILKM